MTAPGNTFCECCNVPQTHLHSLNMKGSVSPLLCATHIHTHNVTYTHTLYAHTQILEIKGPSCSSAVFLQKAFLLKLSTGGAAGSRSSLCSQEQGGGEMDSTNRAARHNLKDDSGLSKLSSCFNSLGFDFCQLCAITHQNEC